RLAARHDAQVCDDARSLGAPSVHDDADAVRAAHLEVGRVERAVLVGVELQVVAIHGDPDARRPLLGVDLEPAPGLDSARAGPGRRFVDVEDAFAVLAPAHLQRVPAADDVELEGEALGEHLGELDVELAIARVAQPASALPLDDLHAPGAELEAAGEVADAVVGEVVHEEDAVPGDEVEVRPGALARLERRGGAVPHDVALRIRHDDVLAGLFARLDARGVGHRTRGGVLRLVERSLHGLLGPLLDTLFDFLLDAPLEPVAQALRARRARDP